MAPNRLRILRKNQLVRDLVSQADLSVKDLIMPYFVAEGRNKKDPITLMPGVYRLSLDNLLVDLEEAASLGIKGILLFGVTSKKDSKGSYAYFYNGIVQKAVRAARKNRGEIAIFTDVCLCGYTTHGHCGLIKIENAKRKAQNCIIDNDETLKILAKIAVSHAAAGADFVAPSAMMDGQVSAIRAALDKNGFQDTGILAYSAKYASSFYGPFRDAIGSAPQFGDRKSYQMDYRNSDEALNQIQQDTNEGANIVLVKPALAYLDIIRRVKDRFNVPIAAYSVSGEYAMLKTYSQKSKIEKELVLEVLTSIKRAGANLIITYHAKEAAKWLKR